MLSTFRFGIIIVLRLSLGRRHAGIEKAMESLDTSSPVPFVVLMKDGLFPSDKGKFVVDKVTADESEIEPFLKDELINGEVRMKKVVWCTWHEGRVAGSGEIKLPKYDQEVVDQARGHSPSFADAIAAFPEGAFSVTKSIPAGVKGIVLNKDLFQHEGYSRTEMERNEKKIRNFVAGSLVETTSEYLHDSGCCHGLRLQVGRPQWSKADYYNCHDDWITCFKGNLEYPGMYHWKLGGKIYGKYPDQECLLEPPEQVTLPLSHPHGTGRAF